MRDDRVVVCAVLAVVVLAGMVMSFVPMYGYDVEFEYSDGTVEYLYESDVELGTTTVVLSNTGDHLTTTVLALLDYGYASQSDHSELASMLADMSKQLDARGVSMETLDAEGMLEAMATADPSSTAVLLTAGAIPDVLYDGTADCPLIDWLERGGTVANAYGVLGKHVATGPDQGDIVTVEGFGELIAGLPDNAFRDSAWPIHAGSGCNEEVRDALHFYMTEYTYGIDVEGLEDALSIGYVSAAGFSSAVAFASNGGMVLNFGVSLGQHQHSDGYIAQIIASGLDYTTEILEVATGDTRDDSSGSFEVDRTCSVYAMVGDTGTVYAERFDVGLRARHRYIGAARWRAMSWDALSRDADFISGTDLPWDTMSGTRVLVTGATGMVGSLLTEVLARRAAEHGFEVTAMSRRREDLERIFSAHVGEPGFRTVAHDVNEPLDGRYDSVFHLASNTHPRLYSSDPIGTISTNVIGLRNLLDASRGGRGRFVFASSVEVYGRNRGDVGSFDESYCGDIDCNTLRAGYNEAKRVGESLCQAYMSQAGVDVVIPRLSRLYGPTVRPDDSKAVSQFLHRAASGEDIVLKSAGTQLFSYCYSADAVSALLHLFFRGASGEAYNVAGLDSDVTLRDLAGRIAAIAGVGITYEVPDEAESRGYSTADRATLDIGKIRSTGWEPSVGLDEGLRRTLGSLASRRAVQEGLEEPEVVGRRDLEVRGRTLREVHRPAELEEQRVGVDGVGDAPSLRLGVHAADLRVPVGLGRLDPHDVGAVQVDAPRDAVVGADDGLVHRDGGAAVAVLPGLLHAVSDDRLVDERPHRVVDDDQVVGRDHVGDALHTVRDGLHAVGPAADHTCQLGDPVPLAEALDLVLPSADADHGDGLDEGVALEHGHRVREDGDAVDGDELLRDVGADPLARSSGKNYGRVH